MNRRWLAAIAAVVVLAVGVSVGTLMAQTSGTAEGPTPRTLIQRVATILGLDEEVVEDAFRQAKREAHDEGVEGKIAGLVESGAIDQAQADEYLDWYLNRPEGAEKLSGKAHGKGFKIRKREHHGTSGILGRFRLRLGGVSDIGEIGQRITDRLVEAGVIEQAQVDEYRAWLDDRPAGVPGLRNGFGGIGALFGSGRLIDGIEGRLDRLVERGVIDQTQADEYLDWYGSRPEGLSPLIPGLK